MDLRDLTYTVPAPQFQARREDSPSDAIAMNDRRQLSVHSGGMAVPAEPSQPPLVSSSSRLVAFRGLDS